MSHRKSKCPQIIKQSYQDKNVSIFSNVLLCINNIEYVAFLSRYLLTTEVGIVKKNNNLW